MYGPYSPVLQHLSNRSSSDADAAATAAAGAAAAATAIKMLSTQ